MGRDSALKGRLIIGAIVGIYFLVQYLASRELDEVTGERHQFAYSVEKEIEIGQAAAPKFIRENGGEASGRAAEMVRRLGNVVVRNTIASKSGDVEISRRVVEIKTAIDRIKEQAQNAE